MEGRLAALRKIQNDMVLNVSRLQARPTPQQGAAASPARPDEASENSIFLAGIPAIRDRLRLPRTADPVYVVSCFLRELEIYSGMDSIVIADNAAQTRPAARAVIIHMRSNFHKRGAMGVLRRELARQKMADTAARDCFPTTTMDQVKRYIRFAMKLKAAGTIDKFQIVNRRGQPILQTGKRNGGYTDFQGVIEEMEQDEEAAPTVDNGPWTTVVRRKKTTSPSKPNMPQQPDGAHAVEGGASAYSSSWAQQIEKDFPELPSPRKTSNSISQHQADDRQKQQQSASNAQRRPSTSAVARDGGARPRRDSRDQPRSQHSSRGNSRTSSRQPSRERISGRNSDRNRDNNYQNDRSKPVSPPPFQSYFKTRAYNVSDGAGAQSQYKGQSGERLTHEQQHRKR
jgi:hypothetical protein